MIINTMAAVFSNIIFAEIFSLSPLFLDQIGNRIEIITFIIDIFNHKDYDKVFGYKH